MPRAPVPVFDDLIGQETARDQLRRLAAGPLGGRVYLFVGPRGAGKLKAALALAATQLCQGGGALLSVEDRRPCLTCPGCLKLAAGSHPDLRLVEPEPGKETISIDQARDLRRSLHFAPLEAGLRAVIIPGAERLGLEAVNALLKTLEEPPEHALIILTAAEAEALPPTVLSRCQKVRFRPIPEELIQAEVARVKGLDPEPARLAASLSGGSLEAALELDPAEMVAARDGYLARLKGLRAGQAEPLLELAREAAEPGEAARFLEVLAAWYRDLAVLAAGGRARLAVNQDRHEELNQRARRSGLEVWLGRLEAVLETQRALAARANARLALEALLLRLTPGLVEGR